MLKRLIDCKTARLYQQGHELDAAVERGADRALYIQYDMHYEGGSIPMHEYYGRPYAKPYSSEYHTGGAMGETLRKMVKR